MTRSLRTVVVLLGVALALSLSSPIFGGGDRDYLLTISNAEGEPGDTITIGCGIDFAAGQPISGASWGVCHDATLVAVDCTGGTPNDCVDNGVITPGDTLSLANGGSGPEFFSPETTDVGDTGWTVGFVVNFEGTDSIAPQDGAELTETLYRIVEMEISQDLNTSLGYCTIGDPTVEIVVGLAGGAEVTPTLGEGRITISAGPPPPFCLFLDCVAGTTDATLTWDPCNAFDYYILNRDGVLLGLLDGAESEFNDPDLAPAQYHYELIAVVIEDPMGDPIVFLAGCDVAVNPVTIATIEPPSGTFLGGDSVTITGTGFLAGSNPAVTFGGTPATDVVVMDDATLSCVTPSSAGLGAVDVTVSNSVGDSTSPDGFLFGFIRGEVNGDGVIGLDDALTGLEFLFSDGAPPICPDALDVDDNGVHTVIDPLLLLEFIFALGPPPAPPHAEAGLDPTDDDPFRCI